MFDLAASPDVVNCTGNSYTPMASRSMPTAKTFVEKHSDCDQRNQFAIDNLRNVDRTSDTRAVNDRISWLSSSSSYPDHCQYSATAGSNVSECSGPVSTTAMSTAAMSTWNQRRGGSPAHVWRHDSPVPPRMHAATATFQGAYGEFGAGGVNIKEEYSDPSDYSSDTCSDFDWTSRSATANGVKSACGLTDVRRVNDTSQSLVVRSHRSPHDKLAVDDDERRRIRRERNKMAAARCRQRRVDLTNQLLAETESLEDEKLQLEKEISNLQRQRHQLEFVLDSHASRCRHVINGPAHNHVSTTTTAPPTSVQSISSRPFATGTAAAAAAPLSMKVERAIVEDRSSRAVRSGAGAVGRPSSLSLCASSTGSGAGLTSTPLTFTSLGLDCMIDGHTGLTPITGAPSCSAGGHRPLDDLSPTTLMTL